MIRKLRFASLTLLVLAASTVFAMPVLGGSVLYVDDDAAQGGDGTSWETAHRFLQEALADASGGGFSEIHVAQGVYKPDRNETNPDGSTDRDATFSLVSGVAMMGGYAGIGADNPDERDIEKYVTILSGDMLGDDQPNFVNYEENSYTVVTGSNTDETAVLDGFTITAGNACCSEIDFDPRHLGGGMYNENGNPTLLHCRFVKNRAGNIEDFGWGGAIYNLWSSPQISECVFDGNWAKSAGGAIRNNQDSSPVITFCVFVNNHGNEGSAIAYQANDEPSNAFLDHCSFLSNHSTGPGALHVQDANSAIIHNCVFSGNSGVSSGGAFIETLPGVGSVEFINCIFEGNDGGFSGGGFAAASDSISLINSLIADNSGSFLGGGILFVGELTAINCVISGNSSPWGGGLFSGGQANLINCSFGGNTTGAIRAEDGSVVLSNCIVWGNSPDQFYEESGSIDASYSNIQGGWQGTGNIDVNPLFVNPGSDNLRLSFGSPCIDAANNFLVPDGIEYDLDGNPRFADDPDVKDTGQGTPPIVDMGAYEGAHESEDAQATEDDLDQGEIVFLIPNGGGINFLENAIVFVTNTSGPDNATFTVTQMEWNPHPSASRFSELGSILRIETSLEDGQFFAQLFIPFALDQLNGLYPLVLDAINFHKDSGNWVLGTLNNTQDSPGRHGPIGDKIQTISGQGSGLTLDLGDYGVLYDPKLELGYVWMNVDQVGDFGLGEQLCIADCQPFGGDSLVHVPDLLIMLSSWGLIGASDICDVDRNDIVNEADLLILLSNWGLCEESGNATWPGDNDEIAMLSPKRSRNKQNADLDNNGIVDRADLERLHAAWGPCDRGSRADLNADGKVGTADLIELLASWGRSNDN